MRLKSTTQLEYDRKWKAENPEKVKESRSKCYQKYKDKRLHDQQLVRKRYPERRLLSSAKYRAQKLSIEFNIDITDVVIPEFCPILNIELQLNNGSVKSSSPSLDRIDNTKGYIKGNVQVVSYKANTMKSSATPEELLLFSQWIGITYG